MPFEQSLKCRMCKRPNLELFLDLGNIPRVDRFLSKNELNNNEPLYPLTVYLCMDCGLAQLGFIVPASDLFNQNYAYESSTTKNRRENHDALAESACKIFKIKKNSLIVDIGSNVGLLLDSFKNRGMKTIGVDASSNIVEKANQNGIETILGFFNKEIVETIVSKHGQASVITATNLFAHIQNYFEFISALKKLLKNDGIFIFQVPHFLKLVKNNEYDTIYHEHISYFGLKPLMKFFEIHEMEIFDVLETDIDGGSIRCFVSYKNNFTPTSNISKILNDENNEGIYNLDRLKIFENDVVQQKSKLIKLLEELKKDGKKVIGVGAPAKGMTLLNYCNIGKDYLEYLTEKSNLKIGKYCPGMHIPIVADEQLIDDKPDYALILAWNFAEEIMKNLHEYKKLGGKFLIPIPSPKIV